MAPSLPYHHGMDARDAEYTEARTDLFAEMLRASAFDMADELRHEFVVATVKDLTPRYTTLGDHLWRQLIGNGMRATYADATLAVAARHGRGEESGEARM